MAIGIFTSTRDCSPSEAELINSSSREKKYKSSQNKNFHPYHSPSTFWTASLGTVSWSVLNDFVRSLNIRTHGQDFTTHRHSSRRQHGLFLEIRWVVNFFRIYFDIFGLFTRWRYFSIFELVRFPIREPWAILKTCITNGASTKPVSTSSFFFFFSLSRNPRWYENFNWLSYAMQGLSLLWGLRSTQNLIWRCLLLYLGECPIFHPC